MLHPLIDKLEYWYIDRGYTPKRLARRFHLPTAEVRKALREVGLEVDGVPLAPLMRTGGALFDRDCITHVYQPGNDTGEARENALHDAHKDILGSGRALDYARSNSHG